jgi:proline iminopeptidase
MFTRGLTPAAAIAALALGVAACDTLSPTEPGNLVPATVKEDPSLPSIELNGARIHAETFGNPANPVIVFLHGGPGGDYRDLLRLAQRHEGYSLADEYFLVFWDQRGAGLSQRVGKEQLTIDTYVADLHALANRYSPGRQVNLVGLSWGGMYATRYINQYPQRVAGAVLIEPGPLNGVAMERLKDDIMEFDLASEWLNDVAWSNQFFSADGHARLDYERMLGARHGQPKFGLSRTDPEPSWRMGAFASRYIMEDGQDGNGRFDYDFTTNLGAFTTPVLFIAGALSQVLGESLQQQQVRHFPSAALEVIDGAGHDVAWVKAPQVVTQIRTYLDARKGGDQ